MNSTRNSLLLVASWAFFVAGCATTPPRPSAAIAPESAAAAPMAAAAAAPSTTAALNVCSFNIQFLGSSARRDNAALADVVSPYDIVVVQELIAAPAQTPNDQPESRQRSAAFFHEMEQRGFKYVLSESDTGRTGPLNNYSTATEWWVTFYRGEKVHPVTDIPHGFISTPLAANPDYDRVPYAFAFRTANSHCDFVLISVHLNPDNPARRKHELQSIGQWVTQTRASQNEKDFIVLGDMNMQTQAELHADILPPLVSLNDTCVPTNVSPNGPKPFDHVVFDPAFTKEIDRTYGFGVINLIQAMRPKWHSSDPYPGDPFEQNVFRFYYSDHNPVNFRIRIPAVDDD